MIPISFLIPTYNEQENIEFALKSCIDISDDVVVLDSYSDDSTVNIARKFGVKIYYNKFETFSKQWNWALENIPFKYDYVFILAADEMLSKKLKFCLQNMNNFDKIAYFVNRKFIWLGKWIRWGGYYPSWDIRLFNRHKCRYEDRPVNERIVIPEGETVGWLEGDIIHYDRKSISIWLKKHINYAQMEAELLLKDTETEKELSLIKDFIKGTPDKRKKYLRYKVYNNFPPILRSMLYFFYRYIIKLGFLDGWQGFTYHFLQGFWFPLIVDILYLEKKYVRYNRCKF